MPIRRPYLLTIIMAAFGCTSCGLFGDPAFPSDRAGRAKAAAAALEQALDKAPELCRAYQAGKSLLPEPSPELDEICPVILDHEVK